MSTASDTYEVFGQPIMTSVAPAASMALDPLTTEQQEADAFMQDVADHAAAGGAPAPMAEAWEAQRDANLAVQQVDALELKVDELHMRVLALTHALHRIRQLGEKNLAGPSLVARIRQICAEVDV